MTHLELLRKEGETEIRGLRLNDLCKQLPTLGDWRKMLGANMGVRSVFVAEYAESDGYDHDSTLVYIVTKFSKIAPRFAGTPRRAVVCGNKCTDMISISVEPMTKSERNELNKIFGK